MRITKKARSDAKRLFLACLTDGVLDHEKARQAAAELVERKPRGYLPVLVHFHRLVKLEVARRTARVESAIELDEPRRVALTQRLEQMYGRGLETTFAAEPALLGGLRVKVGSDVYDGSIQARLNALKESF